MHVPHTLRAIASMPRIVLGGTPGERAGDALLCSRKLGAIGLPRIQLTSPAFQDGEPIPARYSADADGFSPPLRWSGAPASARSLALVVEDPDAPTPQPFVHWLVYNLSPRIEGVPEHLVGEAPVALNGGAIGKSSLLRAAWAPCAPPRGDLPHHYHFQLFALDRILDLGPRAGRSALVEAIRGRAIGFGELVGTYQR